MIYNRLVFGTELSSTLGTRSVRKNKNERHGGSRAEGKFQKNSNRALSIPGTNEGAGIVWKESTVNDRSPTGERATSQDGVHL